MNKYILLFLLCVNASIGARSENVINGSINDKPVIIIGRPTNHPHFDVPSVCYITRTSTISIDFGNQPVNNFTVTISSLYADVDYYATSSFTTIPLAVDGISDYSITIETGDGDLFEGTLYAADYATTATF